MKNAINHLQIKQLTWSQAEPQLRQVRTVVFIEEQFVTPEFEWDEIDANAIHLLALIGPQAVGCLRIIKHQKIGRMAVLKEWRNRGVGMALLQEAVLICRQFGSKVVTLSAQTHAIGFYKKAGFIQTSDEYCDVDIPHVDMALDL
jgi:predicted GNAT family N-acyltransferase